MIWFSVCRSLYRQWQQRSMIDLAKRGTATIHAALLDLAAASLGPRRWSSRCALLIRDTASGSLGSKIGKAEDPRSSASCSPLTRPETHAPVSLTSAPRPRNLPALTLATADLDAARSRT